MEDQQVQTEAGGEAAGTLDVEATEGTVNPIPASKQETEAYQGKTVSDTATASEPDVRLPQSQRPGGKKRKVALFLAYVGAGYQGMQRNPGCKTIEGDLHTAICHAGGISADNATDFSKVHWNRAARTDKGVSAVGQVVSLNMMLEPPGVVQRINAALPPSVRVLGVHRTTAGFDARKLCDKRRYEYCLPAFAFDPAACRDRTSTAAAAAAAAADAAPGAPAGPDTPSPTDDVVSGGSNNGAAMGDRAAPDTVQPGGIAACTSAPFQINGSATAPAQATASDRAPEGAAERGTPVANGAGSCGPPSSAAPSGFAFDDACQERLNAVLQQYEGTHNFHNFTVNVAAAAPSAKRYILSFRCTGTFQINGEQWVRMVVIGQSFMMHQIRRMVGLALAVQRGVAPPHSVSLCLDPGRHLSVPMAPELGLFLDECYYDAYNTRWGEERDRLSLAAYQQEVAAFKEEVLYPHIAARDAEEQVNATWLRTLNGRNYQFQSWVSLQRTVHQPGPAHRGTKRHAGGAAAIVGSMETYGVGKSPRITVRKLEAMACGAYGPEVSENAVQTSS